MRLGDDAEIAKHLKELGVELRRKSSETPHVRHLIQLSAELRGPRGNQELESIQPDELTSGTHRSGDTSMSVDKWKILGLEEQRAYIQGIQDTLCAVLGIRCPQAFGVDEMVRSLGSSASIAMVRVLTHALLLAAAGTISGGVSAKCGHVPSAEQEEKPSKKPEPESKEPKQVQINSPSSPKNNTKQLSKSKIPEEVVSKVQDEESEQSPRMALRPDSSGNLVQEKTTTIGLFGSMPREERMSVVLTSETALPPEIESMSVSRGRTKESRRQQGRATHSGKKAVNDELQDLWNFGREHHGTKRNLTDQEADQIKNGFKREARRFVRDEVSCKTRDELYQLRMHHNAQFRARSQAEAESAAAHATPAGPPSKKDGRGLAATTSRGALGAAGATVTGAGRDAAAARAHAQELRELMYALKPELKPKPKKNEAAEFLAADFKGLLGGPAKVQDKRASVKNAAAEVQPAVMEIFKYIESERLQFSDLARFLDGNGNGAISMSEFLGGLKAMKYIDEGLSLRSTDSCKRLFRTMDKDKSGLISMKELQAFFEDLSPKRRQNVQVVTESEDEAVDGDISVALGNKMKQLRRSSSIADALRITTSEAEDEMRRFQHGYGT